MKRWDLAIIGGGTAGLVAAVGAANLGAKVVLVERERTGGDCLWTGCVPSKTLIASARIAHHVRGTAAFGLPSATLSAPVDLGAVMDRIRAAQEVISHHDSIDRLQSLGVEVVTGSAAFEDARTIAVDGRSLPFRSALIATGSRPVVPPVDGLAEAEPLTSDTIWALRDLPERLVVVGGGAIGVELGQALSRLGSKVTIVEMADRILVKEEPEVADVVTAALEAEGIKVLVGTRLTSVGRDAEGTRVARVAGPRGNASIPFDRILVSVGRVPNAGEIGLASLGVETSEHGHVEVDGTMRTNVPGIFAAGDVTTRPPFTHVAGSDASTVVANALFGARRTVQERLLWATFSDPEVGRVGMSEAEANDMLGADRVTTRLYRHDQLHRAITEGRTEGFTKLVAGPKGQLIGATVVSPTGGEQIATIDAWIRAGAGLGTIGQAMHAYPTWAEGTSGASLDHLREQWFTPRTKRVVKPVLAAVRLVDRLRRHG